MPNPVTQTALWITEMLQTMAQSQNVKFAVATVLGGYLLVVLARRFRSDEDPSLQYQKETEGGTFSMLLSGVHVTMVLVVGIVLVTWPLFVQNAVFATLLLGAVAVHFWLEKRERD